MEIAGREVRTVRRLVHYIPLEFFQKRSFDVHGIRQCVVVEHAHATWQHSALSFWMARRCRVKVSQYSAALIVVPGGMKSTSRMPFVSQKTDAMIIFTEFEILNFLVLGECVWRHCSDCCLDSGVWWKTHVSSPVTMESRNSSPSCAYRVRIFSAETIRFVFWSFVKILGTQRGHNFLYPNFSVTASWIVVLRHFRTDVMQLSYRQASICMNFSFNILKNLANDQRWPTAFCSSWTSVIPSENLWHHFVAFYRFITLS